MKILPSFLMVAAGLVGIWASSFAASTGIQIASGAPTTSLSGVGASFSPLFSGDGHSIVFVSQANNLVTNDDLGMNLDVFVRDLVRSNTVLVSVSSSGVGGANDDANYPSISSNGQFVAFASRASNLVAGDTNDAWDVFVRDVQAGTTRLVSMDAMGSNCAAGPGRTAKYPLESSYPIISADGRWVAFQSSATNLVSVLDTNLAPDVFVRDLQSNQTYLVSINADGTRSAGEKSELAAMSPDGRYVAFTSRAADIVPGGDGQSEELFVRDMQSGTTIWVSSDVWEFIGYPHRCFGVVFSQDGHCIAFKGLNEWGDPSAVSVFRHDLQAAMTTELAFRSLENTLPAISQDGRFVAYEEGSHLFVYDEPFHRSQLVTWDYNGATYASGRGSMPVLTPDGSKIVFLFAASTNGAGVTTNTVDTLWKVYVRDLVPNVTQLINVRPDGSAAHDGLAPVAPALSPDGTMVAFESTDDGLVPGDNNRANDIFVRNLTNQTTDLISGRAESVLANMGSSLSWLEPNCMSADGQIVAFSSFDSNFDPYDTNGCQDVWFRNVGSNAVRSLYYPLAVWLGDPVDGPENTNINGFLTNVASGGPFLSPDGRWASFMTYGGGNRVVSGRDLLMQTNIYGGRVVDSLFVPGITSPAIPFIPCPVSADGRFRFYYTKNHCHPVERSGVC